MRTFPPRRFWGWPVWWRASLRSVCEGRPVGAEKESAAGGGGVEWGPNWFVEYPGFNSKAVSLVLFELVRVDLRQLQYAPEGSKLQLPMHRNDGAHLSLRRHLREPHMASRAAGDRKAELIAEDLHNFLA